MATLPSSPLSTLRGGFTEAHATRLLWRAGFGPRPGEARSLAALGLDGAVASLTRPGVPARLIGPRPHGDHGRPLDPVDVWGDDHLWWLDRMARTTWPLQERMTLVWHSWFATSIDGSTQRLMLRQNAMMRERWLGNFQALLVAVTRDPAMLLWLSGASNSRLSPNENYAREMMELFTLGQGRGYGQDDVREQARALTGFVNSWSEARGPHDFRFDPAAHDDGIKRIFGQSGRFDYRDACTLCVGRPTHPSFLVQKLWSYFVGAPPAASDARALERTYVASGYETRPLIEAILRHPLLYEGPRLVIPPAVWCAGLLRARGRTVAADAWAWIAVQTGQKLFEPPNVSGWNYADWLDTARWAGRLQAVTTATADALLDPAKSRGYPEEDPGQALSRALAFWHEPAISAETRENLLAYSRRAAASSRAPWDRAPGRVMRQNALRVLLPMTPDLQTS